MALSAGEGAEPLTLQSVAARAMYKHGEQYLAGALNEEGLNVWRLAIAHATQGGVALDTALLRICQAYLTRNADALRGSREG